MVPPWARQDHPEVKLVRLGYSLPIAQSHISPVSRFGRWLSPALVFAALTACEDAPAPDRNFAFGDPDTGRRLVISNGCAACHVIPGIAMPRGMVGPPLSGVADRSIIAGQFPNRPEVMMRWVMNAPAMSPDTAMPNLGLTRAEARDVTAFLYQLD